MEKFVPRPITKVIGRLLKLGHRLVGHNPETVRQMVSQTLQTARVNHGEEARRAQIRAGHHRRNHSTLRRSLSPSTGTSLLHALNEQVELEEVKTARSLDGDQVIVSAQSYQDRYSLALLDESLHNTLSAVVGSMMMQHDYRQREARAAFELLTQDRSSVKPDSKFYEKRTEIRAILKARFDKTNPFLLTPSGKEIQTAAISESSAEENYAFQELCAGLLGQPIFSAPFNPDQPIPSLASNARNFDEENAVEHRRMVEAVSPRSLGNLIESLGYKNMKKKAQGPVLNDAVISGNGNNGHYGTPQLEESEVNNQNEINDVVNDYFDSLKFRRRLKQPKLEVVVDGATMSAPFAANSAANRRFHLPGVAKFVQIFATEDGRRDIVSSLSLRQTEISGGKTWHSELELEGRQLVRLTVEPAMDVSGKLASSSLVVGYQPKLTFFNALAAVTRQSWTRTGELWPSWMTKPVFATIVVFLGLAPFFTIDIFSASAFFILMLSLTAFLLVAGRISPSWRLVRPQQVAIDGFVAIMLMVLLFLGILPLGRVNAPAIAAVEIVSPGETAAAAALRDLAMRAMAPQLIGQTFDQRGAISYIWSTNGSAVLGSQFGLTSPGYEYNPSQDYLVVRPAGSSIHFWQDWPHNYDKEASFLNVGFHSHPDTFSQIWPNSLYSQRIPERWASDDVADPADRKELVSAHAWSADGRAVLYVFHVEVLVNTAEVAKLMGHVATTTTKPISHAVSNQPGTTPALALADNAAIADAVKQVAGDTQPSGAEGTTTADPAPGPSTAGSAGKAAALVVFESPTELGSLKRGDVVNANFKPMLMSATEPRGGVLACTATGVVQDKQTSGTDVRVRVGLKFTWTHNGNTVNGNLDLLLTDCAQDKENSHYGVLAAPLNQVAEVARMEPRPH